MTILHRSLVSRSQVALRNTAVALQLQEQTIRDRRYHKILWYRISGFKQVQVVLGKCPSPNLPPAIRQRINAHGCPQVKHLWTATAWVALNVPGLARVPRCVHRRCHEACLVAHGLWR